MKIYFHCSLTGEEQYSKGYDLVIALLREMSHEVLESRKLKSRFSKVRQEIQDDILRKKAFIKASDAVIIESTYPSIGIGYLIAYALGQHKNVLVLYTNEPHAVLLAENNRLLSLKKYDIRNRKKLLNDLQKFLNSAQRKTLKYRFNMMIDQAMDDFLTIEATKESISKADYVRQLIKKGESLAKEQ